MAQLVDGRHTVQLKILDRKAASVKSDATAIEGARGDAGRLVQNIGDGVKVEVLDPLERDDGDRLRRFLERQRQLGGGSRILVLVALFLAVAPKRAGITPSLPRMGLRSDDRRV